MRIKKLEQAITGSKGSLAICKMGYLEDLDIINQNPISGKYPYVMGIIPEATIINRSTALNFERLTLTFYAGINYAKATDDFLTKYDQLIDYVSTFLNTFNEVSYISVLNHDRIKVKYLNEINGDFAINITFDVEIEFWNKVLPPYPCLSITGNALVTANSSETYSVAAVLLATSYVWTLPTGATGTSTTNSITVAYGASPHAGNITCKAVNSYGNSNTSTLAITITVAP